MHSEVERWRLFLLEVLIFMAAMISQYISISSAGNILGFPQSERRNGLGRLCAFRARYKVDSDTPYKFAVSCMMERRSLLREGRLLRRWRKLISASGKMRLPLIAFH